MTDYLWRAPSGTTYIKSAWAYLPGDVIECEGKGYRIMSMDYTVEDEETAFGQHWYVVSPK